MNKMEVPMMEDLFDEQDSDEIVYNGKKIVKMVNYEIGDVEKGIRVDIEKTDSEWLQGIALNVQGKIEVGGDVYEDANLIIWEDVVRTEEVYKITASDGILRIWNVWNEGRVFKNKRTVEAWTEGAAIYTEKLRDGMRFYCNDGHPDDDFGELVFRIYEE